MGYSPKGDCRVFYPVFWSARTNIVSPHTACTTLEPRHKACRSVNFPKCQKWPTARTRLTEGDREPCRCHTLAFPRRDRPCACIAEHDGRLFCHPRKSLPGNLKGSTPALPRSARRAGIEPGNRRAVFPLAPERLWKTRAGDWIRTDPSGGWRSLVSRGKVPVAVANPDHCRVHRNEADSASPDQSPLSGGFGRECLFIIRFNALSSRSPEK
jgi:hypothetical protein